MSLEFIPFGGKQAYEKNCNKQYVYFVDYLIYTIIAYDQPLQQNER